MDRDFIITEYDKTLESRLFAFLEKCMPESGRSLDLNGREPVFETVLRDASVDPGKVSSRVRVLDAEGKMRRYAFKEVQFI